MLNFNLVLLALKFLGIFTALAIIAVMVVVVGCCAVAAIKTTCENVFKTNKKLDVKK